MGRMKAEIEIVLKSDLCPGSGYSYAGIIDSDVCYNENGLPYIPARRLKGCLREAAELIRAENIDRIFGLGGENKSSELSIENAYPKNYEKLNEELSLLKTGKYENELNTQKILNKFTYVKAQTAIDEKTGIAKKNSLRYTRVVKQYVPFGSNENRSSFERDEMCFFAEIEYDSEYEKSIERTVKSLRHIGMNRSRGLGNVQCRLVNITEDVNVSKLKTTEEEKLVRLDYTIKNTSPLMLSANFDDRTECYIKAQMIIGALAAKYLSQNNNDCCDELFNDLFLNGNVKYTNLYISQKDYDSANGKDVFKKCVPAPFFINSLKKSKKLVNLTRESENHTFGEGEEFSGTNGNQPKKLKDKYICMSDDKKGLIVTAPALDIVYHHSKRAKFSKNIDRDDNETGLLYSMEVIRENQYFSGSIIGKKKHIDIISQLLDNLRLGKSKTAQYGSCKIVYKNISDYSFKNELKKDDIILVSLESGAVFIDGEKSDTPVLSNAAYTVRSDKAAKLIARDLKIDADLLEQYTFLQTETVTGYNTVWNLKKPSIPALSPGSVIAYKINKDVVVETEFVGEKNTEGFGKIHIYKYDELPVVFEEQKTVLKPKEPNLCRDLLENIIFEDFMDTAKENTLSMRKLDINPSTLGRLTLMFMECQRGEKNANTAFENFKKRIDSIKRDSEKREIIMFLTDCLGYDREFGMIEEVKAADIDINIKKIIGENSKSEELYTKMKALEIKDLDEKIKNNWIEYLGYILTYQRRR